MSAIAAPAPAPERNADSTPAPAMKSPHAAKPRCLSQMNAEPPPLIGSGALSWLVSSNEGALPAALGKQPPHCIGLIGKAFPHRCDLACTGAGTAPPSTPPAPTVATPPPSSRRTLSISGFC